MEAKITNTPQSVRVPSRWDGLSTRVFCGVPFYMNELHLFAGAGGGILGGILCGHTTVCAVEIEPYCRKVLLQRQRDGVLPKFPIWNDVQTFDGKPWRGLVDIVCGGFPCQDISAAGKGAGIEGERSGLWTQMRRIICEIRPKFVFVENSPHLVSRGLGKVLGDLAEMGMDARWCVLGPRHIGGPHQRDRIWILAYAAKSGLQRNLSGIKVWPKGATMEGLVTRKIQGRFDIPEPYGLRSFNGLANGVDRIKATGNGQVPIVAATAFRILSEHMTNQITK
jgi:DNA (cytosine-5)-methyltransferase 1